MPARHHCAATALAALLVLAGCADLHREGHPSVTFGSGGTPGMGGMAPMPEGPQGRSGSASGSDPVSGDAIGIDNFAFVPATLTIPVGSTVTWINHDEEPHTVAASDGSFHSPGMGSQASYSHTFPAPGKFDYVCSIHPFMHGTVVVTQ